MASWLRALLLCALLLVAPSNADDTIINSPHDLSVAGPGRVRAVDEDRVCIFCHTPHNASPAAPLWNRHNPTTYYRIYESSTTDARIDQPGGSSKLCLSCHDGSIALGLVLSRDPTDPIPMTQLYMPSGPTNLTNDLSDDHPVGLRYDRQLANRDPQIRTPDVVSSAIALGPRGQLECTACHDPHNNELGDFLRITQREGALCVTCHDMTGWRVSAHANSGGHVPVTVTAGEILPFVSLRDNACLACHKTHSAPQRERLLRESSNALCVGCHDGLAGQDVLSVMNRRSSHRWRGPAQRHDPTEDPYTMRPHVDCVDCHNPHAARIDPLALSPVDRTRGAIVPPALEQVPGVTLAGTQVGRARLEYEVCFRCHAERPVPIRDRLVRQRDDGGNIRRQVLPTTASAHPIGFPSRGGAGEVPSLLPEVRGRAQLTCHDCHDNPDGRRRGGSGPNGPHGSSFDFLLAARYETADFTAESPQSYALCYNCHDRNSILNDESFPLHRRHVADSRTPCSACHAPHGVNGSSANHSHLINYDLSIVGGERVFLDRGRFAGSCTLTCHGVRHVNFTYGAPGGP